MMTCYTMLCLPLLSGKRDVQKQTSSRISDKGKAQASLSTLNRLELTPADGNSKSCYKKTVYNAVAIEDLIVDIFLDPLSNLRKYLPLLG